MVEELNQRIAAIRSGAGWFYWVAGLSMINTMLNFFEADINFMLGLGITQFADAIAIEFDNTIVKSIALIFNLSIAFLFFYLGKKANERKKWAFIVGMIILALDSLIFFFIEDYFGLGFHIFAIVMIYSQGFNNLKRAEELETKVRELMQESWDKDGMEVEAEELN